MLRYGMTFMVLVVALVAAAGIASGWLGQGRGTTLTPYLAGFVVVALLGLVSTGISAALNWHTRATKKSRRGRKRRAAPTYPRYPAPAPFLTGDVLWGADGDIAPGMPW